MGSCAGRGHGKHDGKGLVILYLQLMKQLKEGGRLIIPLGRTGLYQTLTLVTKVDGRPRVEYISNYMLTKFKRPPLQGAFFMVTS